MAAKKSHAEVVDEAPGQSVALAPYTAPAVAMAPFVGTLGEKMVAFKQFCADIANSGAAPPGWDTANRIALACWGADATGQHPYHFMMGHHVANFGGRLMLEPRWEYIVGILRARIPGFRMIVHEDTAEACDIEMTRPGDRARVRYTKQDAITQNLWDKWLKNTSSPRQMLFKATAKMCSDRIGGDVLLGFVREGAYEIESVPDAVRVEPERALEAAAEPVADFDPKIALSKSIDRIFGLGKSVPKADKLRITGVVITQIERDAGHLAKGLEGVTFARADAISPFDAQRALEYLERRYPGTTSTIDELAGNGAQEAPAATGRTEAPPAEPIDLVAVAENMMRGPTVVDVDAGGAVVSNAPPPMESPLATQSAEAQEREEQDGKLATLINLCDAAAKKTGNTYLKEAPTNSRVWWFVHQPTWQAVNEARSKAGFAPLADKDRKLQADKAQVVAPEVCAMLVREIRRQVQA